MSLPDAEKVLHSTLAAYHVTIQPTDYQEASIQSPESEKDPHWLCRLPLVFVTFAEQIVYSVQLPSSSSAYLSLSNQGLEKLLDS